MADDKHWETADDRPTNAGDKRRKPASDSDYSLGQLMVESIHFRRRLEVFEARLYHLESQAKDSRPPKSGSQYPSKRARIFALIKTTVTYTIVGIAAIFSALKELGYFK